MQKHTRAFLAVVTGGTCALLLILTGSAVRANDPLPFRCWPIDENFPPAEFWAPSLHLTPKSEVICIDQGTSVSREMIASFSDDDYYCYDSPSGWQCGPWLDRLDWGGWNASGPDLTFEELHEASTDWKRKARITMKAPGVYTVTARMKDVGGHCAEGTLTDKHNYETLVSTFIVRLTPPLTCPPPGADYSDDGGGDGGCSGAMCTLGGQGPFEVNVRDGFVRLGNPFNVPDAAFGEAASQQQLSLPNFLVDGACMGGSGSAILMTECGCVSFSNSGGVWTATANAELLGTGWSITSAGGSPATYTLTLGDGTKYTATEGRAVLDAITSPEGRATTFNQSSGGILFRIDTPTDYYLVSARSGDYRPEWVRFPDLSRVWFEYNSSVEGGGLKKVIRRYGQTVLATVEYTYDEAGRVTSGSLQSGSGPVTTQVIEYDEYTGKVTRVYEEIDGTPTGRETTYSFSEEYIETRPGQTHLFAKTVITVDGGSDPDRVTTKYYYKDGSSPSYLYRVVDPEGNVTENWLYGWLSYFDANTPTNHALLKGRPWKTMDAAGGVTTYEYYTTNYLVKKITYTDGVSCTEYTYTDNNTSRKVETVCDVSGVCTKYEYNDNGQVSDVLVQGAGEQGYTKTKSYTYYTHYGNPGAVHGLVATETIIRDPNDSGKDQVTIYEYQDCDDYGYLINKYRSVPTRTYYQWWYPEANGGAGGYIDTFTWTRYNDSGNVAWTKDALGNKTSYTYDVHQRVTMITYPGPSGNEPYKEYSYNCCNLEWESDENGNKTYYTYDDHGKVLTVRTDIQPSSPAAYLVEYDYNDFGEKTSVTAYSDESSARTTEYTYDKLGRVVQIDYPGTNLLASEYYQYNELGQLTAKLVGSVMHSKVTSGKVTAYQYDSLGRLRFVNYDYYVGVALQDRDWPVQGINISNPDDTYDYYGGSSLVSVRTDAAGTSEFQYDARGRLEIYTPPTPGGWSVEYGYNNANEKTRMTLDDGSNTWATTYDYFRNGWLKRVAGPAGVSVDYLYDEAGKPLTEVYGNDTFAEYGYNNRLQLEALYHYKTGTPNTVIVSADYIRDNVGSPTGMSWDSGSTTTSCSYDDINRLAGVTYPGQSPEAFGYDWVGNRTGVNWGTVNAVDQLPSDPYGNTYVYDTLFGNLITKTNNNQVTTYEYDNYNLLKKINWPDQTNTQFISDAAGNRVRMTTTQSTVYNFMYDTTAGIPAVLMEQADSETPKLYIRTPDGRLIARVTATATPTLDFYYHFDGLGSTRALTDSGGNTTDTYKYDVWGNVTHYLGTTSQPYQFVGQLGYYTHYQEPKLDNGDMLQLGVRYYVPSMGRFTQRDVVRRNDATLYGYSDNAPTFLVDPTGKTVWDCSLKVNKGNLIPHRYICIDNECWGFYPTLVPTPGLSGIICPPNCFKGKVVDDSGYGNKTNETVSCKEIKKTKDQERSMLDKILFDKAHPDTYCLAPVPPISHNCITWASSILRAGR